MYGQCLNKTVIEMYSQFLTKAVLDALQKTVLEMHRQCQASALSLTFTLFREEDACGFLRKLFLLNFEESRLYVYEIPRSYKPRVSSKTVNVQ